MTHAQDDIEKVVRRLRRENALSQYDGPSWRVEEAEIGTAFAAVSELADSDVESLLTGEVPEQAAQAVVTARARAIVEEASDD
jgi:hypothetical protein